MPCWSALHLEDDDSQPTAEILPMPCAWIPHKKVWERAQPCCSHDSPLMPPSAMTPDSIHRSLSPASWNLFLWIEMRVHNVWNVQRQRMIGLYRSEFFDLISRGEWSLLRLLHPWYSNWLWVWPINCMLHGNPIDAVGSSASWRGVLKKTDIVKCKDFIHVHEDVTWKGKAGLVGDK